MAQIVWVASADHRRLPIPTRLLLFASLPLLLIGLATIGYRLLERWSWFDAFYVAVITLTSLGYGDRHAFSTSGRILTVALALGGVYTLAVAATEVLGTVLTGELRDFLGKRRMRKRIAALAEHVILCGYGHVGRHVCADILGQGVAVVAVDRRADSLSSARAAGAYAVVGDATEDGTLRQAGIGRARALVAAAGTDADNVLITMSAHLLRPRLPIVSCVQNAGAVAKLVRAGASRTACPDAIAGGRIAEAVLRPASLDAGLRIEEQRIDPGSPLDGRTVGSSGLRSRRGLILIAIKRPDGRLAFNPEDDAVVAAGDTLITLASPGPAEGADAPTLAP